MARRRGSRNKKRRRSTRSRALGRTTSGRLLRGTAALGVAGAGGYALSRKDMPKPSSKQQNRRPALPSRPGADELITQAHSQRNQSKILNQTANTIQAEKRRDYLVDQLPNRYKKTLKPKSKEERAKMNRVQKARYKAEKRAAGRALAKKTNKMREEGSYNPQRRRARYARSGKGVANFSNSFYTTTFLRYL